MKTILRFGMAFILITILLAVPLRVHAAATQTAITGIMTFKGEPYEDPNSRGWQVSPMVYQCRNDIQQFFYDSDDPRLVGWGLGKINCTFHFGKDGSITSFQLWGKINISSDEAGQHVLWECSMQGGWDGKGPETYYPVCNGRGENKGLLTKLKVTYDPEADNYPFTGTIQAP